MNQGIWSFDAVANFRDFGGQPVPDGKIVRTNQLFRSAHFAEASAADIGRLDVLGVKLLVDLRLGEERAIAPDRWTGGPHTMVISRDRVAPVQAAPAASFSAQVARETMRSTYRRLVTDQRIVGLFGEMLRALADGTGPMVVHCTAGKDRTGLACAVVLAVLGVSRESILRDYEMSNLAFDVTRRRAVVREQIERDTRQSVSDEDIAPLLGVEASYLTEALDAIDEMGGVDSYVLNELKVPGVVLTQMRRQLCVDV